MKNNKKINKELDSYQKAYLEWDLRIGSAKLQAKNWRFACVLSLIILSILTFCFGAVLNMKENYVYIAEIKPGQDVINIRSASEQYNPTTAQKNAFLANFVYDIMNIPLDPVLMKKNISKSFMMVSGDARSQLNDFIIRYKSFESVGIETKTTVVDKINNITNDTYDVTWTVTTINKNGKITANTVYNGTFTLLKPIAPKTFQSMIINPLGLSIGYFSFNVKGTSK